MLEYGILEPLHEAGMDIKLRRQIIASWIQANVSPVAKLVANNILTVEDEEARQEATQFEVREYQLDAWGNVWSARQAGAKSALVHLATGLGKTSVGVFDVMKFQEEFRAANGREPKILFTCHKKEILEQASQRFKVFMPNVSQGFYNGDKKNRDAEVTFATLQSLYAGLDLFSRDEYDYIIDDEVHHAKANTFEQVTQYFTPAFRLGLTATPNRKDEKNIREIYGEEVYSKGLPEALAEGLLAAPDYHIVFDDTVKNAMQSGFKANSLKALTELFNKQPRNQTIARNIKEEMARIGLEFGGVKTIVFCQNIEHAEEMAKLLNGKAYHSDINKIGRRQTFDDFKNGDLQVITTRDLFNEGIDVPDARLLVFLRSTSSQTVFEQQLGRGLRKHSGKERVSILDFVANIERIVMIKQLADHLKTVTRSVNLGVGRGGSGGHGTAVKGGEILGVNFDFDKLSIELLVKLAEFQNSGWEQYTDDEVIALALKLSPDVPLNSYMLDELSREHLFPSRSIVYSRWGSASNFYKACGFELKLKPSELSDDELTTAIRNTLGDGVIPTHKRLTEAAKTTNLPGYLSLTKRFGSLRSLQKACGFESIDFGVMSADEIVALALDLKEKYGYETMTGGSFVDDMSKLKEFPSRSIINRVFGGEAAFRVACSDVPENYGISFDNVTNEDIVVIALTFKPESALTASNIDKLAREKKLPTRQMMIRRFGSLQGFQEACGFEGRARHKRWGEVNNNELIQIAKKISPEAALSISKMSALSNDDFPSSPTIRARFGSLAKFQRACGFESLKDTETNG